MGVRRGTTMLGRLGASIFLAVSLLLAPMPVAGQVADLCEYMVEWSPLVASCEFSTEEDGYFFLKIHQDRFDFNEILRESRFRTEADAIGRQAADEAVSALVTVLHNAALNDHAARAAIIEYGDAVCMEVTMVSVLSLMRLGAFAEQDLNLPRGWIEDFVEARQCPVTPGLRVPLHAQPALNALPIDELSALAEQGNAEAQAVLGDRYRTGQGVSQDEIKAVTWFRRAADQGDGGAQYRLGFAYARGRGVPQDNVLAYMWFALAVQAVSRGPVRGIPGPLGPVQPIQLRDMVATQLTAEQLAEARRLTREWKPTPAPSSDDR